MDNLLKLVPKNRHDIGYSHKVYKCSRGCLISESDIVTIRVRKSVTIKCPYCGSHKLEKQL